MQPGDVYQTYADTTTLQEELKFKPNTPIQEGVKETIRLVSFFLSIINLNNKI